MVGKLLVFVVKRIYDEYLNWYGLTKIANGLNKDKILSPLEYKTSTNTKPTVKELKKIFNQKYFKYIKRKEKRNLGGCIFE